MAKLSAAVETAKNYYDSADADTFYALIWGGEDIHIGLYQGANDDIAAASQRTIAHMAKQLSVKPEAHILDLGSGFGGASRYLASNHGAQVTALNLSSVENERHRQLNERTGLSDSITVIDGNFEDIPCPDEHFDIVWSQDAILHSDTRETVLREVDRVLKKKGQFIFTDPMQSDTCPEGVLQPILDRIHLTSLGSPRFYRTSTSELGWTERSFEELTNQLVNHYQRVLDETIRLEVVLHKSVDPDYVERMKKGLRHWVDGGRAGYLSWGIFHFEKA